MPALKAAEATKVIAALELRVAAYIAAMLKTMPSAIEDATRSRDQVSRPGTSSADMPR
jgi:hypothetical protein